MNENLHLSEEEQLKKMKEKADKLGLQIRQRTARLKEKKRKERTRHLIEIGGLTEIAKLSFLDKGVLLGAFIDLSKKIQDDSDLKEKWKLEGDAILAERSAEREARRKKMEGQGDGADL